MMPTLNLFLGKETTDFISATRHVANLSVLQTEIFTRLYVRLSHNTFFNPDEQTL